MAEYDKIGYSAEGINYIPNALSEDLISLFSNYLDSIDEEGNIFESDISNQEVVNGIGEYMEIVKQMVIENYTDKYGVPIKDRPAFRLHLTKWGMLNGFSMPVHSDAETPDGTAAVRGGFYLNNITTLTYITTDYDGGNIFFPDFDVEFSPEAGSLLMFPSRYRHGIRKLEGGRRYTVPMFFSFDIENDLAEEDQSPINDTNPSDILFHVTEKYSKNY